MSSAEITDMLQRGHLSPEAMRRYLAGDLPAEVMRAIRVFLATNPLYADAMDGMSEMSTMDDVQLEASLGLLDKRRDKLLAGRSRVVFKQFEWIPKAGLLAAAIAMIGVTAFVIRQITKEDAHRNFADLKEDKSKRIVVATPDSQAIVEAQRLQEDSELVPKSIEKCTAAPQPSANINTPSAAPLAVYKQLEQPIAEVKPTVAAQPRQAAEPSLSQMEEADDAVAEKVTAAQSNSGMSAAPPVYADVYTSSTTATSPVRNESARTKREAKVAETAVSAPQTSAQPTAKQGQPQPLPLSPAAEYERAMNLIKAGKQKEAKKILQKIASGTDAALAEKAKAALKTLP